MDAHTTDGLKPIEEINVGNLVLSLDEATGEEKIQPVVETYVNLHRDVFELRFTNDSAEPQLLIVTLEHPFHTQDGAWKPAGKLKIGEQVQAKDGWLTLQSVRDVPNDVTTYNFMVAEHHNYFVGEQRLWVHNCCGILMNPRSMLSRQGPDEMTPFQINRMAKEMKQLGYGKFDPIDIAVIEGRRVIINGHRAVAAAKVGLKEIPVNVFPVTPEQGQQFLIEALQVLERR